MSRDAGSSSLPLAEKGKVSRDVGSSSLPPAEKRKGLFVEQCTIPANPVIVDPFFLDENLYTNPVVFPDQIEALNDDLLMDEEVHEYYDFEVQDNEKKICGCPLDCDEKCCNIRPNGCKDMCGCLCYRDNFVKIKPIPHPRWSYEERDGDNYGPYLKSVVLSDGFDIIDYRPKVPDVGTILKMDQRRMEEDCVKEMAVLAMKRYNRMFGGGDYRVSSVVKANSCGAEYYITFIAADSMGKGEPKIFQALVESYGVTRGGQVLFQRKVLLCRPKGEVFIDYVQSDDESDDEGPPCCDSHGKR